MVVEPIQGSPPKAYERNIPLNLLGLKKEPEYCRYVGCLIKGPFEGCCATHFALLKALPSPSTVVIYRNIHVGGGSFARQGYEVKPLGEALRLAREHVEVCISLEDPWRVKT